MEKGGTGEGQSDAGKMGSNITGFKDGRREPKSQGTRWPLEAGKVKATDSSLEPPERSGSSDTVILAQ